jgi:transposase
MVDTLVAGSSKERRRYRRWSAEAKRAICLETRAPGVSMAQVAQRHALNANLIFKWLRDARFAPGGMLEAAPVFLPVQLRAGEAPRALSMVASEGSSSSGRVEIVLADGHRLTASGAFDGDAVARLLAVLVRS